MDHFLVYKTTHIPTGRFYIGRHVTSNIDDGYMGSGTMIRRLTRKYPKSEFSKEILYLAESGEKMLDHEEYLISNVIDHPLCLNCVVGDPNSRGVIRHSIQSKQRMSLSRIGFKHSSNSKKKMSLSKIGYKHSRESKNKMSNYSKNRTEKHKVNHSDSLKKAWELNKELWVESFKNRPPITNETKLKHSISSKGERNPRALNWIVESASGKIELIRSIKTWCKEKDIKYTSLLYTETSNKFYDGYKVKRETHG